MRQIAQKGITSKRTDSDARPKESNSSSQLNPDVHQLLHLQRTVGNQVVQRMLGSAQMSHDPAASSDRVPQNSEGFPNADPSSTVTAAIGQSGQPLGPETRPYMDQRFGYDFSKVRVHTDAYAEHSAAALNARAFTLGNEIVFGSGEYAPATRSGKSLIAHELAHVVQQQNSPVAVQGKLRIGSPVDSAELSADTAARAVMAPANKVYQSPALQIRGLLRDSPQSHTTIQRAPKSWGGEFSTDKYELLKAPGTDGVEIELRFKPNKHVDAELIGMTQTARSSQKGGPVPANVIVTGKAEEATFESYRIPKGEANAGTMVDQLVQFRNPMYATGAMGAKDTLATTPTSAGWGQHGKHFTDKAGKLKEQDALLKDKPALPSGLKESSQVFESTPLAIQGVQEGTFYGSVQWGWEKNAAGKVSKLPLTLVSNDVPSSVFARATEFWNKAKTSKGEETIDLPTVEGRFTNTQGVWLVRNPSNYKTTIIGMLEKNTRLEVTNKGPAQPFNKTADKDKWWKVTVVDGTHIGKVGWVMQADLSNTKTK
jgi:hypothetical protein